MMTTQKRGKLVFLHLSDIHLRKEELLSAQDVDKDIRGRLKRDLQGGDVPVTDGVDGILVSGDISFQADSTEFESAHVWLAELCELLGCDASSVWVIPGNHDVNRTVIKKSQTIQDVHDAIRRATDRPDALRRRLQDATAAENLLIALGEYNVFAERYSSESRPNGIFWESAPGEFQLSDGSELRLRGLNSVLISDENDKDGPPAQLLGLRQVQLEDDGGVAYLVMAHHPPDWLYDHDQAQEYLYSRASIALFGHKHRQRAHTYNQCLVIGAGALHPDRGEQPWEPKYNLFEASVVGAGEHRHLRVAVYQREWKPSETCFGRSVGADAQYPKVFTLALKPWQRPAEAPTLGVRAPEVTTKTPEHASEVTAPMPTPRHTVYRFFSLPYPTRMGVLLSLGLLLDGDEKRGDGEVIRLAVERARERGILAKLEQAIQDAAKDGTDA